MADKQPRIFDSYADNKNIYGSCYTWAEYPKKISKNANGWKSIYLGNFEFGVEVMAWQKITPPKILTR